jgi:hypothetical protein
MVLAQCIRPSAEISFGQLDTPISASRRVLDACLGIEVSHLTPDEARRLLPIAYRAWALDSRLPRIIKNHEAFTNLEGGVPVFPPDVSHGVVYIVRDPRDIAISLAAHIGKSIDEAICRMEDPSYQMGDNSLGEMQVPQRLLAWSQHAESWLAAPMPRLLVRYEDMIEEPIREFSEITKFCRIPTRQDVLARAVEACSFGNLQALEKKSGFIERSPLSTTGFFREGRAGAWRQMLSRDQIGRIEGIHGAMMLRFGYTLSGA